VSKKNQTWELFYLYKCILAILLGPTHNKNILFYLVYNGAGKNCLFECSDFVSFSLYIHLWYQCCIGWLSAILWFALSSMNIQHLMLQPIQTNISLSSIRCKPAFHMPSYGIYCLESKFGVNRHYTLWDPPYLQATHFLCIICSRLINWNILLEYNE